MVSVRALRLLVLSCVLFALGEAACLKPVANCESEKNYFTGLPAFLHSTSVKNLQNFNTYITFDLEARTGTTTRTAKYMFVRCGCDAPSDPPSDVRVFSVPVSSVMVYSTVTIPKVEMLGQINLLDYLDEVRYVSSEAVQNAVAEGEIIEVKDDFAKFGDAPPDVLIVSSSFNEDANPSYDAATLNPRLLWETDSSESTPLGRAELIKLYGVLFGVESVANSVFGSIERSYLLAKNQALSVAVRRPTIAKGTPWSGTWYPVSDQSYFGQLLRDANVDFISREDIGASSVTSGPYADLFSQAEYWIDAVVFSPGNVMTEERLLTGAITGAPEGDKAYFSEFLSVNCETVFGNDNKLFGEGNSFFEEGVLRPDLILNDLVQIFHSRTYSMFDPNRQLHFYRKITSSGNTLIDKNCSARNLHTVPSQKFHVTRTVDIVGIHPAVFSGVISEYLIPA